MNDDTALAQRFLARRFGVIVYERGDNGEEVLATAVGTLRGDGLRLGGLYQRTTHYPSGKARMELIDIARNEAHEISQDLGNGSESCALNPSALLDAGAILRRDMAQGVDLLVVSKFAGMEVDGEGLAAEAFEALGLGIPVLTCLSTRHQDKFQALSGGLYTRLPPDVAAVRAWTLGVVKSQL